jgi:hypothetical protein
MLATSAVRPTSARTATWRAASAPPPSVTAAEAAVASGARASPEPRCRGCAISLMRPSAAQMSAVSGTDARMASSIAVMMRACGCGPWSSTRTSSSGRSGRLGWSRSVDDE